MPEDGLKACVLRISQFLEFENPNGINFFKAGITQYSIPKYQREYKWHTDNVNDLIIDVAEKYKFLGIIALEEKDTCYEIVDGQQRVTTITLCLAKIFNLLNTEQGRINRDQAPLEKYIINSTSHDYILRNETVNGAFLKLEDALFDLCISDDIYRQEAVFLKTYETLEASLEAAVGLETVDLKQLVKNFLDSSFLVFINDSPLRNRSTEEIYMDINYKSQILDNEDIFKGYCFKYVDPENHNELKSIWEDLKTNAFTFKDYFNYLDFNWFLYSYFLSQKETYLIKENLHLDRDHILKDQSNTVIFEKLEDMKIYSNAVIEFYKNASLDQFFFEGICSDARSRKGDCYYITLKQLVMFIMEYQSAQYHKLPFFIFLKYLKLHLMNKFNLETFGKMIVGFYIYSVLFNFICTGKNKNEIERDLISFLHEYDYSNITTFSRDLLRQIRQMRINVMAEKDQVGRNFNLQLMYAFYSVLDNYNAQQQKITSLYSRENGHDDEHLIIHSGNQTEWVLPDGSTFLFRPVNNKFKNKVINHLILPMELNGPQLGRLDIVEKIQIIKDHFNEAIPNHVDFFLSYIEDMPEYTALTNLKENEFNRTTIERAYNNFVTAYFSFDHTHHNTLLTNLYGELQAVFRH